jgi:hypothetical protein
VAVTETLDPNVTGTHAMSVPVIKAITRQLRHRMGGTENAAIAAGLSNKGKWSLYESENHPDTTLPLHRFLLVADADARAALIRLLEGETEPAPTDLNTEAGETTEASADMQRTVREAQADGVITPFEKQQIRAAALRVHDEADDVMRGAS